VAQTLKTSYRLREETERLLKVKPWITPVVVFTKAFVKMGQTVKGLRMINQKHLILTLLGRQIDTSNAAIIWANRERLANYLTGKAVAPVQGGIGPSKFSQTAARN
jgi:hypothetical protein